jgi:hypothetical protein
MRRVSAFVNYVGITLACSYKATNTMFGSIFKDVLRQIFTALLALVNRATQVLLLVI